MMILVIVVVAISIYCVTKYFVLRKKPDESFKNLYDIPCPNGLPIFGNISDFLCDVVALWKRSTDRAVKYYPIYRLKMFNTDIVYLLHPEDVQMILNNQSLCIKGKLYDTLKLALGNGIGISHGKLWYARRKVLSKAFDFTAIQNYVHIINRQGDSIVRHMKTIAGQSAYILPIMKSLIINIANEVIIGEKSKMDEPSMRRYERSINTISKIMGRKAMKPFINLFYKYSSLKIEEDEALRNINAVTSKVLEDSYKKTHDDEHDFTAMKILFENPELFDELAKRNELDTLFFGGYETTSTELSFVMMVLGNFPKFQEEIYQEMIQTMGHETPTFNDLKNMNFLDRFLKECLRLFPPVVFIARQLVQDITTKTGYKMPSGTSIVIPIFHIHRNPNIYPEPNKFNPDRFLPENMLQRPPASYLPFGGGPRSCIAQKFAMLQMKASVCNILKNFTVEAVDRFEDLEFIVDFVLKTKTDLRVKLVPRT